MGDIYPVPNWQVSLIIFSGLGCVIGVINTDDMSSSAMMSKKLLPLSIIRPLLWGVILF